MSNKKYFLKTIIWIKKFSSILNRLFNYIIKKTNIDVYKFYIDFILLCITFFVFDYSVQKNKQLCMSGIKIYETIAQKKPTIYILHFF